MANRYKSVAEGVSLEAIRVFVELFKSRVTMEIELLERRFEEQAKEFEKTLMLMEAMQAVSRNGRNIRRASGLGEMDEALEEGQQKFLEHMAKLFIRSKTEYGDEMRALLGAFQVKEGLARLGPRDLEGRHHAARNILIEAGAIQLDHDTSVYTIEHWFYCEFIKARYSYGTTPQKLQEIIEGQVEIGALAESRVFDYERKVVGKQDADKVVHVALDNSGAGFDIMSVRRKREGDQPYLRMIEVKAVSMLDWEFTLTNNEIRVAEEYGSIYFLYLVPIIEEVPAIDKMEVIQDPIKELLHSKKWNIENRDWKVRRKI